MIRIAVVGPESTGKSTLAGQLAAKYHTVWVPEYAREYIDNLKRPYSVYDIESIARGQIDTEERAVPSAKSLLICDTNLIVVQIWFEHAYGYCPEWIRRSNRERKYHLHLLTDIDIPWEPDPQREHPLLREYLFNRYKCLLDELFTPYVIISGKENQRLNRAIQGINDLLDK
jgi:NadR type nicotinamide-nucleotide adenylyltransferase